MRSISISHTFPHSLTHSLTNVTLRTARNRKYEPVSTVLYASSILTLPSFLPPTSPPSPLTLHVIRSYCTYYLHCFIDKRSHPSHRRNGRSSYPSCNPSQTQDRNKCGGGCPRGEYCDKNVSMARV